jgi:hypothetical protein
MAHGKIKAAARRRMAQTGGSHAAARREAARESRAASSLPGRFAISHDDMGPVSAWAGTLPGGGPGGGRIEAGAGGLRLRMAGFKVDVPRASVRRAARSLHRTRGTIGVHGKGGSWLASGSAGGLVEIAIDPPCRTGRCPSTLFRRARAGELIGGLADPDGLIAAVQRGGARPRTGSRKE